MAFLRTLFWLKRMKSHPIMTGQAKSRRHVRLPKRKDTYPAGMEPKTAPKLMSEPTQDASSTDRGLILSSEVPSRSLGVAGADQPPTQPVLNDIIDAKHQ